MQKDVQPVDFADGPRRRLAEVYWDHQRDEGEPVFNEFLGVLTDPEVKELAVRLLDDVLQVEAPHAVLKDMIAHLRDEQVRQDKQKLEPSYGVPRGRGGGK